MARKARRGVSTSGEAAGTQETITAGPLSLLGMLSSYNTFCLAPSFLCKNITLYKEYEQSKTPSVHNTDYLFFPLRLPRAEMRLCSGVSRFCCMKEDRRKLRGEGGRW